MRTREAWPARALAAEGRAHGRASSAYSLRDRSSWGLICRKTVLWSWFWPRVPPAARLSAYLHPGPGRGSDDPDLQVLRLPVCLGLT